MCGFIYDRKDQIMNFKAEIEDKIIEVKKVIIKEIVGGIMIPYIGYRDCIFNKTNRSKGSNYETFWR